MELTSLSEIKNLKHRWIYALIPVYVEPSSSVVMSAASQAKERISASPIVPRQVWIEWNRMKSASFVQIIQENLFSTHVVMLYVASLVVPE
jgi:hypothetical protein